MRRAPWILVSLSSVCTGAAAGQQDLRPIPQEELMLSVTAGAEEVEFGKAFPLTVVRVWSKELEPEGFRDEILAPLVLKPVEVTTREDDRRVEETRLFSAWAFSRDEIGVPAAPFRAMPRDRGQERIAFSEPFTLRVLSALDAHDPSRAELPRAPFPAPLSWVGWPGIGAVALTVLSLVVWFSRRRAHRPAPPPPRLFPHERAAQRLAQLRRRQPDGFEETRAFFVDAAEVLREYLEERYGLIRAGMTTEELFSDQQALLEIPAREELNEIFSHCDLAKFAHHIPSEAERTRLLTALGSFVAETAPA